MRTFKCPKCGHTERQPFAVAASHKCPKNHNKDVELVLVDTPQKEKAA